MRSPATSPASRVDRVLRGVRGRLPVLAAALVVAAGPGLAAAPHAEAHDFWIEPERSTVAAGSPTAVALRVGDALPGEPVARNPSSIERFAALGPHGEEPIAGIPGRYPAGTFRPDAPGAYWLLYRSRPTPVTLAAEKFESYLEEEGLEHVLAARRDRGRQGEDGRELFSRCAKALLSVVPAAGGDTAAAGTATADDRVDLPIGLDLELVPESDPRRLPAGGELTVRLLYRGEPLAGALLDAVGPHGSRSTVRTDDRGRAVFRLPSAGRWLLAGVHMVEAGDGSGADWESLWASLRFEVPER